MAAADPSAGLDRLPHGVSATHQNAAAPPAGVAEGARVHATRLPYEQELAHGAELLGFHLAQI